MMGLAAEAPPSGLDAVELTRRTLGFSDGFGGANSSGTAMSRPNIADTSSASSTLPAAGPRFVIGRTVSTCATRSFSSTARSRNSSSGCRSSRAPTPYSTAATCLHIERMSGQLQEKRISDGRGNRPRLLPADPLHHALGQAPLQQLDQRIDPARAVRADRLPVRRRRRLDADRDVVERRAADHRRHLAAARSADRPPSRCAHRCARAAGGSRSRGSSPGCRTTPCPRTWWRSRGPRSSPARPDALLAPASPSRARPCGGARRRERRAPSLRNSVGMQSFSPSSRRSGRARPVAAARRRVISVRLTSPPPASSSSDSPCFDSIKASIFSSTVPRQTNLCTSTFLFWPMRKARSVAWFSTAGFHQRSKCTTCEAAVRVSPAPPAFSDSTKNGTVSSSWKRRTSVLAVLHRGLAVQHQPGAAEDPAEECGQRRGHLAELGEHQHLLLPRGDHLGDLAQARQLAAVRLGPGAVAQPLRRMVADLLEPHQHRQHDALALDAVGLLQAASPDPRPPARRAPPACG